jgi:hypothetical protein
MDRAEAMQPSAELLRRLQQICIVNARVLYNICCRLGCDTSDILALINEAWWAYNLPQLT